MLEQRNLGRSGLQVSLIGLGCNNFAGRIDFAATQKVVHKALDLGITLFDNADTYGDPRGGAEEYLGQNSRGSAQGYRAGDQVRPADGCLGQDAGRVAALHPGSMRGEPETASDRLHRPLLAAYRGSADAGRGDDAGDGRPRAPGKGALHRVLDALGAGRWSRRTGPPSHRASNISSPARSATACWSASTSRT